MTKKEIAESEEYKAFISGMREVAEHYREIQDQRRALGLFLDDRELLKCHECGLFEDIDFIGKLFTYRRGDNEFKETGLQFIGLDDKNERFKCPSCGAECTPPPEPPLEEED